MDKNTTLGHYTGFGVKKEFGIEIEVEGENLPYKLPRNTEWTIKNDGSLRDGLEYVLKTPRDFEEAITAIKNLNKEFEKIESKPSFSFRTSVHIHCDVLHMNKTTLCSFLYLSHILEDALVKFSGEHRTGNRFCLRSKDAEKQIDILKKFISSEGFLTIPEENFKYTAINLCTIRKYGSVEFRSMRGTMDTEILTLWISTIKKIREFSEKHTIQQIADMIKKEDIKIVKDLLSEPFDYPELLTDIKEAYYRLIEIPYLRIEI